MERQVQSPGLFMRILKYAFVVSAFLFIFVAIEIPARPQQPLARSLEMVIAFAGLACILGGFFLPGFLFAAAERAPQGDSAAIQLKRWVAKGVISLAYFEACILFGLVLHFLGARVWIVELLFAAGIAAELFWSPGEPPGAGSGEFSQG
jgi:hypothetical protein